MYHSGLVLEGGGSRAIYSAGVTDAFLENGITFSYVIGVSAGACIGASYLGKNKGRYHDIMIRYINDKRYMGASHLLKQHEYINGEWVFGELTYELCPLDQEEYERSGAVFCCAAVNALTGKAEYFYPKSLRNACPEIQASCSLPLATKGVAIGGQLYFDGGLVDSIPLARALEDGCEKAVVILTQDKHYVKKPIPPQLVRLMKKYPLVGEAMKNRHLHYREQQDYVTAMAEQGLAYVIQPRTALHCQTLEKSTATLEAIYQLGYRQGLDELGKVRAFLA
ncbi:MAG: patatin family protein [Eubacterium sp.]|nr:patatin family protein [Eubacterium sp.]